MQTFLPYTSFAESAKCLDWQRLGKQRVEVLQILNALLKGGSCWQNHPAVKMWRGYEGALVSYGLSVCQEWCDRGFRDTCFKQIADIGVAHGKYFLGEEDLPPWFGDPAFHLSHKSNLIRKMPTHYGKLWPDVPNNLEYVWPV